MVLYARRSQKDEGPGSVPAQLASCRERAAEEEWEIIGEYADDGISGYDPRKVRPQYEQLIADLRAGLADAPLAADSERLLRQDKEGSRWLALFEAGEVKHLKFVDESDINLRRAQDRRDFKKRVADAVHYSERLSEKERRMHRAKAARGEWPGGRKPFGYRLAGGPKGVNPIHLEIEPREAAAIREAAREVLAGTTLHSILRRWSDGPKRVVKESGARWCYSDLRRILTSPRIAGMRGDVKAQWEAIVDLDTHRALVELLKGNGKSQAHEAKRVHHWPLASIVFCDRCGRRMQGAATTDRLKSGERKKRRTYACGVATGGCGKVAIAAHRLERLVIAWALDNLPDPGADDNGLKGSPNIEHVAALQALRELEERKSGLGVAYAQGLMTPAQVKEATDYIDDEIARLRPSVVPASPATPTFDHVRQTAAFWGFMEGHALELPHQEIEPINAWLKWGSVRVSVQRAKSKGSARFEPSRVKVTGQAVS